jgi:hypothetical protein
MGHKDPTYVVFDGDEDKWAYAYMLGWNESDNVDFDFYDAHDLDEMTSRAQGEAYVKKHLRERMKKSSCVVALIGESTKNLYRFVRWELELAQELGKPIVAVNLNGKRSKDDELCPPIIRDGCTMHVAFKAKIIKHALDNWPGQLARLTSEQRKSAGWHYPDAVYERYGL